MSRLGVELLPSGLAPRGSVAVAELLDAGAQRVHQFIVAAGELIETDVAPGEYAVRVEFPSGDYVDQHVKVGEDGASVVIDAGPALEPERLGVFNRVVDKLPGGRGPTTSATLWEFDTARASWAIAQDVGVSAEDPTALDLTPGRHRMLSYGDELVAMPAASSVEVTIANGALVVTPKSASTEALGEYLESGRLDLCAAFADALLDRDPEQDDDPALETLVGYYLVRAGRYDTLARWRERRRAGSALPDQQIIEAWSWLRGQDRKQARARLLDAVAAGAPTYRDGLRLLLDGLRLMAGDKKDLAVQAAVSQAQTYAQATDLTAPVTAFPGVHPQEPEPAPAQVRDKADPWATERGQGLAYSERLLRVLLLFNAAVAGLSTLALTVGLDTGWFDSTSAAVTLAVLLTLLSVLGAVDVKRFGWLSAVIAVTYFVLIYVDTLTQPWTEPISVFGWEVQRWIVFPLWLVPTAALTLLLVRWGFAAARDGNDLRYLHPVTHDSLVAVVDVLVDASPRTVTADEVARNVDRYVAELQNRHRIQLALLWLTAFPLLTLKPPLSSLGPDARKRLLERHLTSGRWAIIRAAIRLVSQLVYLGYYGDPRSWAAIGYERPSREDAPRPPLRTLAIPPRGGRAGYDTIIVGSGPAGAVLAYRLAESGRRVLVLERGPHVDRERYAADEAGRFLHLYTEAGLQMTAEFKLQVFQGACLGGGSSLHRGLTMLPAADVLHAWAKRGLELEAALRETTEWLAAAPSSARAIPEDPLRAGLQRIGTPGELMQRDMEVSAQDSVLARAQRDFAGRVEVLSDCDVRRIDSRGGHAIRVSGRHRDGLDVAIPADEVVIAAGAIWSSRLLRESRLGGDSVGRDLHFNLSCGVTAEFAQTLEPSAAWFFGSCEHGYGLETWRAGPVEQALLTPGWFERHIDTMRATSRMARASVLVGTTTPSRLGHGASIRFEIGDEERQKLVSGLEAATMAYLKAGALRVMPSTLAWCEIDSEEDVPGIGEQIRSAADLQLFSSHPQGGNAIGAVVDADFRVRGTDNVYVCDSSVFPTSLGVEPQLTVMALAHHGAQRIVAKSAAAQDVGVRPASRPATF